MASQGPNSPSSHTEYGTGLTWTNLTNTYSSNNSYATVFAAGATSCKSVVFSGYGFSIPSGATIDGIIVEIERKVDTASTWIDTEIYLVKTGTTVVGSNKSAGVSWSTSESYISFGSASDLWGTTWTDTQINTSSFGTSIKALQNMTKGSGTASVDHVRITVHYTGGGGGPTSASALLLAQT